MNTISSPAGPMLVIGGGAAGLTAALVLARARHQVLVIHDETHRNTAVEEFHGFPTRDATPPNRFRADAASELRAYGVTTISSTVTNASTTEHGIAVTLANGVIVDGHSAVVATGVHDELPAIDGLAPRWGKSVFNCPFCDGWEHRDQAIVVIDAAPGADQLAIMLRSWTPDVTVVSAADVVELAGDGHTLTEVKLRDGRSIAAAAAFLKAPIVPRSDVARQLGCELDRDGYVLTDPTGATTHPRVWAAGDIRRPPPMPHQVVLAAADGSAAAIAIHKAFVAATHAA